MHRERTTLPEADTTVRLHSGLTPTSVGINTESWDAVDNGYTCAHELGSLAGTVAQ